MSSLDNPIPVLSAIFALISAFKDGGTIAEKIRDRRHRRGAQIPNEKLHHVLAVGVAKIQEIREEGVEAYGEAFANDAVTASRLKDITITLQDSIIRHLAAAHNDDDMNDFIPAINSVIQARREATVVLNDLCMTLQRGRDQIDQAVQAEAIRLQKESAMPEIVPPSRPNTLPKPARVYRQDVIPQATIVDGPSLKAVSSAPGSTSLTARARPSSWFFSRSRRLLPEANQRPQSQPLSLRPGPDAPGSAPKAEEQPLSPFLPAQTPSGTSRNSVSNRVSSNTFMLSPPQSPHALSQITEANRFVGFCKGAWHAQHYRLARAMEPSLKRYEWSYHCKKCKFRLLADTSRRGDPHFDDRMQVSGTVYFRFLFLWKCHIPSKGETRHYQCLLCALSGNHTRPVEGEDRLFEHIAQHKGGYCGDTQISGALEIHENRVSVASIGTFDLYIPPNITAPNQVFMLPESAMTAEQSRPFIPTLWYDEPYENVWRSEVSQAAELE